MGFTTNLNLLRFIEKNLKKIKAKERDQAIEEEILKKEANEARGKRSESGELKFQTDKDFEQYRDKIYERKGTFSEEYDKRLKREAETEGNIQDMIDSTIYGRPPRNKKYKRGGMQKKKFGGMAIKGVKSDVPIY
jgi:hypothetical protein